MRRILIAGGGTAGWLTALFVRKFYAQYDIVVVESEDIGILGAGEGTVPHFVEVLDSLNIPMSDLIRECRATIKIGIRFQDWATVGDDYFHPFVSTNGLTPRPDVYLYYRNLLYVHQIATGQKPEDLEFQNLLCKQNKVPFMYENVLGAQSPINSLRSYSNKALHFDAKLLAQYLRKVAESRGINRVEGVIQGQHLDHLGQVCSVDLDEDRYIECDFVFDCTGFARKILEGEDEWISYSKHLPMDSAIPFFYAHDDDVAPETVATAMPNGWTWQIPVQGRYGCGYVYDSTYAEEDDIIREIQAKFGDVDLGSKRFKFDPGTFRTTYIRNCMRVGLSQSFVEPLEATSIWIACQNLIEFLKGNGINNKSTAFRDRFNRDCLIRNQETMDFIYLHYMSRRDDSCFWREFHLQNKIPDTVAEKLELIQLNPTSGMFENSTFTDMSWLVVASNMGLTSPEVFSKILDEVGAYGLAETATALVTNQTRLARSCMSHKDFLRYIRGDIDQ